MKLRRLVRRPSPGDVFRQIEVPDRRILETERLSDAEVDTTALKNTAEAMMESEDRSSWDATLATHVHHAFAGVERRTLLDISMWHWVTTYPMRDFVVARWLPSVDLASQDGLTRSEADRFLGGPSLVGFARNALARLYWSADALVQDPDDSSLVPTLLGNQDFFVGVFERRIGLYPPAAQACAIALADSSESERRNVLARLNFVLSTSVMEELDRATLVAWMQRTLSEIRSG